MPKLTTHKSTVVAQNGEMKVHITLELHIKLDSDGLTVQAKPTDIAMEPKVESKGELSQNSKTNFMIPHFDNAEKIDNVSERKV